MKRIALNGFGRIGKNFLRIYLTDVAFQKSCTLVAINIGTADVQAVPYMINYDSLLGNYKAAITLNGNTLTIDNHKITIIQETDAHQLPWKQLAIDIVVDATGHYTHAQDAQQHIAAGAKKVVITAPAQGEDITLVMGVNQHEYNAHKHTIISLGSCTTNALVPLIDVMKKHLSIQQIMANTVHAYTNTQALLDVNPHTNDLRRSRAAALNIVPSSTGAARAVTRVFPEYTDILQAHALRVPVPVVSLADIVFLVDKNISREDIDAWFDAAAHGYLKNILAVSNEPLVSSDYQGNSNSVTFDTTMTSLSGNLVRIWGWYDNEWGYSNRIKDFLLCA